MNIAETLNLLSHISHGHHTPGAKCCLERLLNPRPGDMVINVSLGTEKPPLARLIGVRRVPKMQWYEGGGMWYVERDGQAEGWLNCTFVRVFSEGEDPHADPDYEWIEGAIRRHGLIDQLGKADAR